MKGCCVDALVPGGHKQLAGTLQLAFLERLDTGDELLFRTHRFSRNHGNRHDGKNTGEQDQPDQYCHKVPDSCV